MDRSMTIEEKRALLQGLGTKQLMDNITKAEGELETLLKSQAMFRQESAQFIKGARSSTCDTVEAIEAKLALETPAEIGGKKTTETDKKAWLERQKTDNKELAAAYDKQKMADVVAADFDVKIKMAEIRLNDLRAILSLRVSQITFFAGDCRITINTEEEIKKEAA